MKRSIFSLPSPLLNGQLGPLRAFLAEEWPERKSKNTSAMLEVIHLPLLQKSGYPRRLVASTVEISKQPHVLQTRIKTSLQSQAPLSSALLFLQEEARPDTPWTGSSSTSLKLLAPSQMYMKKRRPVSVRVCWRAGGRMRRGFHARETLERFPSLCICLADTRIGARNQPLLTQLGLSWYQMSNFSTILQRI